MQEFLDNRNTREYESELLNNFEPCACKYCGSVSFIRYGKLGNGENKYYCKDCGRYFSITTNIIFDNHKIPISECMEFMLGVFRYQSFTFISKSMRIADTTKYWMNKLFLLLKDYQSETVLSGKVWIDETFYKVIQSGMQKREDGLQYRGLSRNQMCVDIACSGDITYCGLKGFGKPSQQSMISFSRVTLQWVLRLSMMMRSPTGS
ncbi:MAG: hypothetical protein WCR02_05785 [Sphaerochaetaceae bacterium]